MKFRTLFALTSLMLTLTSCSGSTSTSREQPEVTLTQTDSQEQDSNVKELMEMLGNDKIKVIGVYNTTNDHGKTVERLESFKTKLKDISIQQKKDGIINFTANLDNPYYLHNEPIQFHYDSNPYQKTITNEEFSVLPAYPFDNQFFYDKELPIEYVTYDETDKVLHRKTETLKVTPETVKNIEIEDKYHDNPFLRLYIYIFTLTDDTYIRGIIRVEYSPKSDIGYKNWSMDPGSFFHQSIDDPKGRVTQTP